MSDLALRVENPCPEHFDYAQCKLPPKDAGGGRRRVSEKACPEIVEGCLGKVGNVAKEGWTVLFVSHNGDLS
jgi:hypothetical protein